MSLDVHTVILLSGMKQVFTVSHSCLILSNLKIIWPRQKDFSGFVSSLNLQESGLHKPIHHCQQAIEADEVDEDDDGRWCYCQESKGGGMVACKNNSCPTKWYHLACLQRTAAPSGKCICPTCHAAEPPKTRRRKQWSMFNVQSSHLKLYNNNYKKWANTMAMIQFHGTYMCCYNMATYLLFQYQSSCMPKISKIIHKKWANVRHDISVRLWDRTWTNLAVIKRNGMIYV